MCAHSTASHAQTSRFCCLATSLFFPRPLIRSCRALIRGGASQHRNALQRRSGERVGVSVMHHSHSTARFRGPAHYNTHTYTCSTCLAHLLRSPLSRDMSSRIHINGLQQYDDTDWSPDYSTCRRKSHPKSCEQHNSLHRPNSTARGNSPLTATQFLELEDTRTL